MSEHATPTFCRECECYSDKPLRDTRSAAAYTCKAYKLMRRPDNIACRSLRAVKIDDGRERLL